MSQVNSYQTKKGKRWEVNLYIPDCNHINPPFRNHKKGFLSKQEADLWRSKKVADYEQNHYLGRKIDFSNLYDRWFLEDYKRRTKESTWAKTADIFRLHILPVLKSKDANSISVNYCQELVDEWFNAGLKQYTRFRTFVINVFDFGINHELITYNPMKKTSIPRNKKAKKNDPNFYDKQELNQFLNEAKLYDSKVYTFFAIASHSGLRKGEILGLKYSDIDFDNRLIHVQRTVTSGSGGRVIELTPKTESSIRSVSVGDDLITILRQWKHSQFAKVLPLEKINDLNNQHLFLNTQQRVYQPSKPNKWLRSIYDRNKNLKHISVHGVQYPLGLTL